MVDCRREGSVHIWPIAMIATAVVSARLICILNCDIMRMGKAFGQGLLNRQGIVVGVHIANENGGTAVLLLEFGDFVDDQSHLVSARLVRPA